MELIAIEHGILKALDYSTAINADDVPAELNLLTQGFVFERDLVRHCFERRMRHVCDLVRSFKTSWRPSSTLAGERKSLSRGNVPLRCESLARS